MEHKKKLQICLKNYHSFNSKDEFSLTFVYLMSTVSVKIFG